MAVTEGTILEGRKATQQRENEKAEGLGRAKAWRWEQSAFSAAGN